MAKIFEKDFVFKDGDDLLISIYNNKTNETTELTVPENNSIFIHGKKYVVKIEEW